MTDNEKKYRVKKQAAEMLVNIYDLAIDREREEDSNKKAEIGDQILDIQKKRSNILKRIK